MDSSSHSRRRDLDGGGEDLEEGEYVPCRDESSDDTDGEDGGGYWFQPRREGDDELIGGRMRRLEDVIMASGRVTPPSSCESDGTISDDATNPSADSSVALSGGAPAARFACHVCGRRFGSPKAVDGHMKVHGNARHVPAVGTGWAATGKRGWTGGKSSVSGADATLNSESMDQDTVAARPFLEPVPMAIAMTSQPSTPVTSARTNLSGEESSCASAQPVPTDLATVVTGPNNSSTVAVVSHQAAPPAHAPEQAQLVQQPLFALAPRPAQPPREYSCKLCGKTYTTHQGLGGHAAGHRNRQKEAEAAAAGMMMMGPGQGGGGRGEPHECQKCHKVFATGVALGGHMRMHYTGQPIVHKKSKRRCLAPPPPTVSEADLRLALSTLTKERPAPAVVAGRVRLFGIDIGPQVQVPPPPPPPPEEAGSSGTAEGSSTKGGRQQ